MNWTNLKVILPEILKSVLINRFVIIVLDSAGIGALPDASLYGDAGADTLGHVIASCPEYSYPNLSRLGLCRLLPSFQASIVTGCYGRLACASPAKDTTAGHWELCGLILPRPFPTYPDGFPRELIAEFERKIGTGTLGNCTASGTEIIKRLGAEHCRSGYPIVYTSADSVFQIAAHEEVFGLEKLYRICRIAREMLVGEHAVGRVIARPFTGRDGSFSRTANRRDFSLSPFQPTILDRVKEAGGSVTAIGKIEDIFNGQGITKALHTGSNAEGMRATLAEIAAPCRMPSVILTNLVDYDMMWGHRRDVKSYARGLKEFDEFLPSLLSSLAEEDIVFITADHGCDPTYTRHTDHTREYVPLLAYGKQIAQGVGIGTRSTFADVAQTIADIFRLPLMENGTSFKEQLLTERR